MTDISISGNNNVLDSDGFIDIEKITEKTRSLLGIGVNSEDATIHAEEITYFEGEEGETTEHAVSVRGDDGDDVLDLRFAKFRPVEPFSNHRHFNTLSVFGHGGNDTLIVAGPEFGAGDKYYGGDGDDAFVQADPAKRSSAIIFGGEGVDTVMIKDTVADADIRTERSSLDGVPGVTVNGMFLIEGVELVRFYDRTLTIEEVREEALIREEAVKDQEDRTSSRENVPTEAARPEDRISPFENLLTEAARFVGEIDP